MGKVVVITGQAGTGKTYSLIELLSEAIPQRDWLKFETILALTFMHGSRKRLESNLKFVKAKFKIRYDCSTIDSFAINLLNRCRSYLNIYKAVRPNETTGENLYEYFMSWEIIREKTVQLLQFDSVRKFISNSYPYILIDEFQDCHGTLLEIVKQLSLSTNLFIASDQFQQLYDPENFDGMEWMSKNEFEHIDLNSTGIKRTKNDRILLTATSLRTGVLQSGKKIEIIPCPVSQGGSVALAAYHLKVNIYYRLAYGNIAIISPTQNDFFVKQLLNSLTEPYKYKKPPYKTIGPYSHLLGFDSDVDIDELIKDLPKIPVTKNALKELKGTGDFVLNKCADKLLKRLSLRNLQAIPYDEFCYVMQQMSHIFDNFYKGENKAKIIFTTIHGAKNREFDNVIIVWPYKVPRDLLQRRKLLYNAITRAKRDVVVIVQHKNAKLEDLAKDNLFGLVIERQEI